MDAKAKIYLDFLPMRAKDFIFRTYKKGISYDKD